MLFSLREERFLVETKNIILNLMAKQDNFFVHTYNSNGNIIPNQPVDIIGTVLSQYGSDYQILVRTYHDLIPQADIYLLLLFQVTNISQSGFNLHWITNIAGSTELFFGNTRNWSLVCCRVKGDTTEHNISVGGLLTLRNYYMSRHSVWPVMILPGCCAVYHTICFIGRNEGIFQPE